MLYFVLVSLLWAGDDGGVIIGLGGKVQAASPGGPQAKKKATEQKRISLDLHKADIHSVIRLFATISGKSFIVADGVKGKVTLRLQDVPWSDAFQAVLWSQGLAAQEMGKVVVLGPVQ